MNPPKALSPGSSEPKTRIEIDRLLTYVPELSFFQVFECDIPVLSTPSVSHEGVDKHFDNDATTAVVQALRTLEREAAMHANGGLAFLVRTMLHFVEVQPVPASEHPLLVALYLRGAARKCETPDTPRAIASQMDQWA